MSEQKRKEFYGRARPGTELLCGFDGGRDNGAICGATAIVHVWPGEPPETREDYVVWSCTEHFAVLQGKYWDYHQIGGACGMPGSEWVNGPEQGKGMCRHELDETAIDIVELAQNVSVPSKVHR